MHAQKQFWLLQKHCAIQEVTAKLRRLNRNGIPVPPSLLEPSKPVQDEMADATTYYAERTPWSANDKAYKFGAYSARDIKSALRELAGGNCAYCESKIGGVGAREVEHYRPKGRIEGIPNHTGYWWLALAWENLLPTCRDCNKSLRQHIVTPEMTLEDVTNLLSHYPKKSYGKASQFDILGTRAVCATCDLEREDPLLINPCDRNPESELEWDSSSELPIVRAKRKDDGLSVYGQYTIRTCALNRAELVLDRMSVRRQMRAIRARVIEILENWNGDEDVIEQLSSYIDILKSFTHPEQPFTGMAAAFVDMFTSEIEQWLEKRNLFNAE